MLPREYAVAPYDKEPFKKRQMEKEKLIKESEKVFDDKLRWDKNKRKFLNCEAVP